jgi:TolB-like protein
MDILGELKRRRVIRAAVVYATAAYATVAVADVLVPALLLPEWTVTLVALLLILGAPVTLVLAWMFDLTPEGVVAGGGVEPGSARILTPVSAGAAVVFVLVGLGAGWLLGRSGQDSDAAAGLPTEAASPASVAVLPFDDLSPEGDQGYFSDGIAEEIIHALARVPGLEVPARTSSFAFRGRSLDARAIGDSLGVGAVLEGSVRTDGERLRITAQLIDVSDGFHVWSETYDRQLTSVFEVQEDIARAIVEELKVPLGLTSSADLVPHRAADVDAYGTYLEARELFNARGPGVAMAIERLEEVVGREPAFAPAWALMAEAYALLVYFSGPGGVGVSTDWELGVRSIRRAQEAAERALALDSLYAPAHAAMGTVARERLDWQASERHLRRAIELDPDYAEAHSNLGEILYPLDRVDEARQHHLRAIELEPRTFIYRYNMAWLAYVPHMNVATLEHLLVAEHIAPDLWYATHALVLNYTALGRYGEAREALERSPTFPEQERAALLTVLRDLETGRRTEEGRRALRTITGFAPHWFLAYGDTVGAARAALETTARYPYYWGGFLGGFPELKDLPDFREARRRRALPN